ncbi:MAG: DNA mismatch repair protein MutS [Dehalococcoidia bacterium]|nr:DNA mismatch repair protein MutS [Dehalococcoidia bacterium]
MTPIRRQYLDIKRRYPHAIVLFRLGDFYETFDDDAKLCARELDLTLTSKPMGKNVRVPLAGIPYHALDGYLARLIAKGYKVAICEQMGDPAMAKGLVDRQVVRVVTPGTVIEGHLLDERANNYLVALAVEPPPKRGRTGSGEPRVGLAYVDISTGEFAATQLDQAALAAELSRLHPAELLLCEDTEPPATDAPVTRLEAYCFEAETARSVLLDHFRVVSLAAFGCDEMPLATCAAGAAIHYLRENQKAALGHVSALSIYNPTRFMLLDAQTRRNLELFGGGRDGDRRNSLLGVLDLTRTALGARLLRRWLGQPLLDVDAIRERQDGVAWFHESAVRRGAAGEVLAKMPDFERLLSRISSNMALPREVVALRRGLELVPDLRAVLDGGKGCDTVAAMLSGLDPCDDIVALIAQALEDEPANDPQEGGVVRSGFAPELDELRSVTRDVRRYLAELEAAERARSGIKTLKVGYNRVFGYYIEVSRPNLSHVPDDYQRRQTLVGGERFVTEQLKEYESRILSARERIGELESGIFRLVCAQVAADGKRLLALAAAVAAVDVRLTLAEAASRYGYCRPDLLAEGEIVVRDGRHPIVERTLASAGAFVPNDVHLSAVDGQIILLTGPNMAGKSTYLRQVALIVLMAQIGSFVPAASARIGVVDRVFTRVGAQEDIASGQSTFMVEMLETANILHNATPRSLVILDEIGRGTSTYDGMAIARAVVEYLHNRSDRAAKTLFATHYHELVALAQTLPHVRNYNVAVTEEGGSIVFLHRIVPGGADKSYGVHVAELAGLPKPVVQRARDVLAALESQSDGRRGPDGARSSRPPAEQLPLLAPASPLLGELAGLEVDAMTPLEAITKLYELREKAREDGAISEASS